jgi:hypothetical protein
VPEEAPGVRSRRFDGEIAGVGTTAGPRIVVGRWFGSPLGSFADVMIESTDGFRVLLAPTREVAQFVGGTYRFDELLIGPVSVEQGENSRLVTAPGLSLELRTGPRTGLGRLLRLQPRFLVGSPAWASLLDPIARRVLPGVRMRGSAGGGRREFYGACDLFPVIELEGRWRGTDLGALAPVDPPVTFGFGSVPRRPSLTRLVTTVIDPSA